MQGELHVLMLQAHFSCLVFSCLVFGLDVLLRFLGCKELLKVQRMYSYTQGAHFSWLILGLRFLLRYVLRIYVRTHVRSRVGVGLVQLLVTSRMTGAAASVLEGIGLVSGRTS